MSLASELGEAEADTIMELLPTVEWSEIATKHDLELVRVDVKSELIAFRVETGDRFSRIESRMAGFESRMAGFEERMAGFEARMAAFEERLNSLIPKLIITTISVSTAMAGLIFAAVKLGGA
ncbi:MAG: hypothetical protein DCC49_09480 [Acidobacteria bacterium]|nr:MAG: hypothetical protein DCC49_09480 [Acidobacteriota bacterium]